MSESESTLLNLPEKFVIKDGSFEERLVFSYRGMKRFDEAVALISNSEYRNNEEDQVLVAESMVAAGISPDPVLDNLERLNDLREQRITRIPADSPKSISWNLAKMYALAGDYDAAVAANIHSFGARQDALTYAIGLQIDRGEDPSEMLTQAEVLLKEESVLNQEVRFPMKREYFTPDYIHLARLYARAGKIEDARRLYSEIEQQLDSMQDTYNQAFQTSIQEGKDQMDAEREALKASDSAPIQADYEFLAMNLAESGMFEEAITIARKLQENKSHYLYHAIESIIHCQLSQGLAEEAVETASMLGGPIYLEALARKAVIDAANGRPYQKTVQEVESILEGNKAESHLVHARELVSFEQHVSLQMLLAEAYAKNGNQDMARTHLKKAEELVQQEDDTLLIPGILLLFANGIDTAGFDASGHYSKVFQALHAMIPEDEDLYYQEHGPGADIKWSVYTETVRELFNHGYFDLAEKYIDGFTLSRGSYDRSRTRLIAELASAEMRRGLSLKEIESLSQYEVMKMLEGSSEETQEAVQYFGLVD